MSKNVLFLDRERNQISAAQWGVKFADEDYRYIRRFDNGKVRVFAEWAGKVVLAGGVPIEHALPFVLRVWNIVKTDENGDPLPQERVIPDVEATQWFRTEIGVLAAYEDFLVRYAGCEWLPSIAPSGQRLIEKGNRFDKARPREDGGVDQSIIGSW